MIRFKGIAYIVLALSLLLNHTPIANSQEVISVGYGQKVIPVTYSVGEHIFPKEGVTWQRRIPTEGGSVALDLEISSTGTVAAEVSGDLHFYEHTRMIKARNLKGALGYTSEIVLSGDILMDFTIPLPEAFFEEDADVHINHKEWISEIYKGKVEGANSLWRVFSSSTQVWGRGLGSGTVKTQAYPSPPGGTQLDLVPYVAEALHASRPLTRAEQIFADNLSDYLDARFDLYGGGIQGELTLTSKAITVNGIPITRENHPIPAPGFDPTQATYRIESNYDEEVCTYKLDASFQTLTSAAVTVLGDIEIWSYEHAVKTDTPLIRESILDLEFEGVDTSVTINVLPELRQRIERIGGVVPDQALAWAIWSQLDLESRYLELLKTDPKAKRKITQRDMKGLRELRNGGRDIISLTGLKHATNLVGLYLSSNRISKVSLSDMPNLVELDFSDNAISEVSLSDMPNLKELNLLLNPLSKVVLSDVPSLTDIRFFNNAISEMSLSGVTNLGAEAGRSSAGSWGVSYPINSTTVSKLSLSGPTEVTVLNLNSSAISEVSLLDMPNLTEVRLSNNAISDISAWDWQSLPNLEKLDLSYNAISGPSFPFWTQAHLTNLRELDLSHNALSGLFDWGLTPSLASLTKLDLSHNNISDTIVGGMPAILIELDIGFNALSRAPLLTGKASLTKLDLRFNAISDISGLSGLPNLQELWLSSNAISDISSLSDLPNLTELYLNDNTISDVSKLSEFTNLTILLLTSNAISDISSLSDLPNLTELKLSDNLLSEVSLSDMPNLTKLHLAGNPASKLMLSNLPNLTELYLPNPHIPILNPVMHVPDPPPLEVSLSGLSNLTELNCRNYAISEISLSDMPNLEKLNLPDNAISDVSSLSGLPNLTELDLSDNAISDVSSLVALPNLTELYLYNNPLNHAAQRVHIPAMQARGVNVYFSWTAYPRLVKISGEDQIHRPGTVLPTAFVVQALDFGDIPMADISIRFAVYEGGGTLNDTTVTTDANGKAQTVLTLGPDPGTNKVAVSAEGFEKAVSFTATANLDAPPVRVAADVNGDGIINIQDLVFVSANLGKTGENAADINGDGVVNIQDLVQVSAALQ